MASSVWFIFWNILVWSKFEAPSPLALRWWFRPAKPGGFSAVLQWREVFVQPFVQPLPDHQFWACWIVLIISVIWWKMNVFLVQLQYIYKMISYDFIWFHDFGCKFNDVPFCFIPTPLSVFFPRRRLARAFRTGRVVTYSLALVPGKMDLMPLRLEQPEICEKNIKNKVP